MNEYAKGGFVRRRSAVSRLVGARGQRLDCVLNCAPPFLVKWERWDCAQVEEGDA